jgi:hypothetical protein
MMMYFLLYFDVVDVVCYFSQISFVFNNEVFIFIFNLDILKAFLCFFVGGCLGCICRRFINVVSIDLWRLVIKQDFMGLEC